MSIPTCCTVLFKQLTQFTTFHSLVASNRISVAKLTLRTICNCFLYISRWKVLFSIVLVGHSLYFLVESNWFPRLVVFCAWGVHSAQHPWSPTFLFCNFNCFTTFLFVTSTRVTRVTRCEAMRGQPGHQGHPGHPMRGDARVAFSTKKVLGSPG